MWQRFSKNARLTVFYAQQQAARFVTTEVSTEHLLLGLLQDTEEPGVWPPPPIDRAEAGSAAGFVLRELGADIASIRAEVEKQMQTGNADMSRDMELTPHAKRVIDLAYDEARSLNHSYIGLEHLLLGLIREEKGLAGRVLAQIGVELDAARAIVADLSPKINLPARSKQTFWSRLFGKRPQG